MTRWIFLELGYLELCKYLVVKNKIADKLLIITFNWKNKCRALSEQKKVPGF